MNEPVQPLTLQTPSTRQILSGLKISSGSIANPLDLRFKDLIPLIGCMPSSAAIGIIGGADGPTAIYTASKLAPELIGPIAVAAYSYMALVPVIQPPIIKALTTKEERSRVMEPPPPTTQKILILFPIITTIFTGLLLPSAIPLIGMLMLGNLFRESRIVERLVKTTENSLLNMVTIFLGVSIGASMTSESFLKWETIGILLLGLFAFAVGTATGVIFGKLMAYFSKTPINPMIGAAGVSAVPMSARVVQKIGLEENPKNFLLMHAMGPIVAGVLGSAVAAGILLALVGGIIGIFLGHWLASFLLRDVASTLNYIYGANLGDQLLLSIEEILIALFMPFLGTLLISINFILRLYQMFPNNLNCLILWEKLSRKKTSLNLSFAILLIALIFILARSSLTLLQSFSIIGLVIITASCLLPIVLRAILLLILSSISTKMPLVKWFLSDSYQQVNRTALSLTALMLAVAVTIGVDSMVKSFKETFNIWLENRLITEIYVRTQDETLASRLISELKNEEMIKNIYPMINIKSRFKDQPITIVGFEPAEVYIKNWPLLKINETTWDDIQNGNGVLINEQFFFTYGLDIGVTIQLDSTLNLNRKVVHQIVGIYSDYGNRLGQIMMNMSSFQKDYSKDTPLNFAVDIHPLSFEMVANMLKNKYGLLESEIINQSTIKEFSTKVFDRTFSITNALSDAMIIIATITLLITLITLSEIRIANLAPLWVLGITRSTLLKFELTQFIMLIILTLSFAIPTGLLICHLLTNYVNVAAFGWKLPFQYYPKIWTQTIFIASLASLFSILFPSIILFKNSPALMIKRYKNDV